MERNRILKIKRKERKAKAKIDVKEKLSGVIKELTLLKNKKLTYLYKPAIVSKFINLLHLL